MTTNSKSSRKLKALALIAPAALVLAACDSANSIEIKENGSMTLVMEFHDTDGMMSMLDMDCADFEEMMQMEAGTSSMPDDMFKIEDVSEGGVLGCKISADSVTSVVDGQSLVENDDTYVFTIEGGELGTDEDLAALSQFNFTFDVIMPGDIVSAPGANISGNVASYTDITTFSEGVVVEGYKTGSGGSGGPTDDPTDTETTDPDDPETDDPTDGETTDDETPGTTETTTNDGEDTEEGEDAEDSGMSPLIWVLIGVAVLGLLGLGAWLLSRNKKNDDGVPPYGGPGGYNPTPGQGGYGNQPQGGYNPQAPYGQGGQNSYGQNNQYGQPAGGYNQQTGGYNAQNNNYGQPAGGYTQPGGPAQQGGYQQGGYEQGSQPGGDPHAPKN